MVGWLIGWLVDLLLGLLVGNGKRWVGKGGWMERVVDRLVDWLGG